MSQLTVKVWSSASRKPTAGTWLGRWFGMAKEDRPWIRAERKRSTCSTLWLLLFCVSPNWVWAQAGDRSSAARTEALRARIPEAFHILSGTYIDVVTDLELDAELEVLPVVFDQAVPKWCEFFRVQLSDVKSWRATAFIMGDRQRFVREGLIPEHLPEFPYGFQFGDEMWVTEQPSTYYRRHLLLHEGTHWFMNRHFGSNGPPWIMEGMAEWFGTHRWEGPQQRLELAIMPASKSAVPFWGRIRLIREQLRRGAAPSLEAIMRYGPTAHREVDAYAWSWAAVSFMLSHPETEPYFRKVLEQPMRTDLSQARWLFRRLGAKWPSIRADWNAYVTDLDYGFTAQPGLLTQSVAKSPLTDEAIFTIRADRSWQATGLEVEAGTRLEISAEGESVLRRTSRPWKSLPDGITLDYHQGNPLGSLLLTVVADCQQEVPTQPIEVIRVGAAAEIEIQVDGELHFRVNEATAELADNSGAYVVRLTRKAP